MPKPDEKIVDSIEVSEKELEEQKGKFFVKDGQVFVRSEEKKADEKEEKTYDDEGFDEKGFDEKGFNKDGFDEAGFDVDGKDADGKEKVVDDEELSEEDLKGTIYEGKTKEEIALMHKKALKTPRAPAPKPVDDKKVKDAKYYESELDKVEDKLEGMSKFDEGYVELRKQQRQLERRYMSASQKESIEINVNAEKNVEFIEKKRQQYADLEIEITPEEFDDVTSYAEKYMEKGKITDRSFTKGLLDKFGSEKVEKFFTMKGEKDARRKIKDAGKKTEKKISTKASKAGVTTLRNISSMNKKELDDYLESLSPAELAELYEKQTRR